MSHGRSREHLAAASRKSRRNSPSRSRSTPNTTSISRARRRTSPLIGAMKVSTLPDDLDYATLPGLSNEAKQKLHRASAAHHRPRRKIDGMTPAALTLLVAHVRRGRTNAPRPNALEQARPNRLDRDLGADARRRLRSPLFQREIEQRLGKICRAFAAAPAEAEPGRAPRRCRSCGPGTSPIRCSCCRSRRRRESGPISAPAPDFPALSSPARWPAEPGPWCIWLKVLGKRPTSCARPCR